MFSDIFEAHIKLKNKDVSSVELTQECLKNLGTNPNNSFISITAERALETAEKVDAEISKSGVKSYLHGIPYSLKDLFITKNIRTTAGSKMLYNYIPPYEGYVSRRLNQAGGILVGKTGCDEFGMGSSNDNTAYGPVTNPIDSNYVPGGSSGGSAISVLEKSSYFSMGTDTGGSVRLPANFCGLVGFKPSYGRISRYGQIAYGSSLDQAAPFGNSAFDMAIILDQLTENDPNDSTQAPLGSTKSVDYLLKNKSKSLKGFKIGYYPEFIENCRSDVQKNLKESLDKIKNLGAELIEVELPHSKYSVAVYYIIATSEASSNLARFDGIHYGHSAKGQSGLEQVYIASRTEGFCDEVKRRILLGTFCLSSGYSDEYFNHACKVRRLIRDDFYKAYEKCDFVFSPVCATTSFRRDEDLTPLQMYMTDLYTIPVNLAGLPSIALPSGTSSENKMPTGFQLIGKAFDDERLLSFAHNFMKGMQA